MFFAKELIERGYQVALFASSFSHNKFIEQLEYPCKTFYIKTIVEKGFLRIWIKTPPYYGNTNKRIVNQLSFAYRTVKAGSQGNQDTPDVIIGSSVHLFAGLAGYYLASKYKVPFIFEVRDLWPQTLVDIGALNEKSPITYLLRKLEIFLYKKADKIISVLPKGTSYITALGIDREKVIYIPNGISLEWFDSNIKNPDIPSDVKKYFNSTALDKFVCCYTGAMGIANGLDTIIDAAKILCNNNNIQFLLVGAGPEKEKLLNKTVKEGIGNVTFISSVDKEVIPYILVNSDVCLFHLKNTPVFKYGVSSNKIFDYMASGKPMISAMNSSIDFVEEANCGVSLPPDDPIKMAEAVQGMAELSIEDRIQFGKNGRKYVEDHHDYALLTKRLLEVIEESKKINS